MPIRTHLFPANVAAILASALDTDSPHNANLLLGKCGPIRKRKPNGRASFVLALGETQQCFRITAAEDE
jgi:hypothetical protein